VPPRSDDLNWRAGLIVLRGEPSREEAMPLHAGVGEALSANRQAHPASRQV
jgi:hypothetical protein